MRKCDGCSKCDPVRVQAVIVSRVHVTDSDCWEWQRAKNRQGYGLLNSCNNKLAHRVSYEAFIGPIPEGLALDHLCRNKACVNPAHLEPVTLAENILRSESPTAINNRKTHCPKGHPLTYDNLLRLNRRARICKTCHRERVRVASKNWPSRSTEERRKRERGRSRAQTTHCKRGHELTPENTYSYTRAGVPCRGCKTCKAEASRKGWERRRAS